MNGLISVILIAIALGCDAFSVALSVGAGKRYPRQAFRIAFHFGLFQAMMPCLGWALGASVSELVKAWDHWIGFALLMGVGGHMIWEAFDHAESRMERDRSRGMSLVVLSTAVSIDALAVGILFGVQRLTPWWPCVLIGLMTAAMSWVGIYLGRRARGRFGKGAEIFGGVVLVLLAIKCLAL